MYDKYGLPYKTPTIGLWIPPADFVRFLANLDYYSNVAVERISYKESHVVTLLEERKNHGRYKLDLNDLIIGRIDDVDLIFVHYKSFEDAKNKWEKRIKRINKNNILVKMNDQNGCTETDFKDFLALSYKNKIFFTGNPQWRGPGVLFLTQYEKEGYVLSDTAYGDVPINTTELLNSMECERKL